MGVTTPLSTLAHLAVPFFVLGMGVWCWVLLRQVSHDRWKRPQHWLKAVVCTLGVGVGMVPVSIIGALPVAAMLK